MKMYCLFSRFPLLWIILPHCKLFLWAETIVEPTLDSSNTSVVEEVDSLVAEGHRRFSSVAEGSKTRLDNTWVCFVEFHRWDPSLWTDFLEKEIVGFIENRAVVL